MADKNKEHSQANECETKPTVIIISPNYFSSFVTTTVTFFSKLGGRGSINVHSTSGDI